MRCSPGARLFAALVALVTSAGLALQFDVSLARTGSAFAAIWVLVRYFTIITNGIVAIVFAGVALDRSRFALPSLLGGVTLAILLVGVVYNLLLRNLVELSGGAQLADLLLHQATPVLAALFWLVCVPKGALRVHDPFLWALYPLAYFAYAMTRGRVDGVYAYPFIDVGHLGLARTTGNAALIALGFIGAGMAMVWSDARLARRKSRVPEPKQT